MIKKRLINCDFLNACSFIDNISNKGKLLYIYMFLNGDDMGFVSNANTIVNSLEKNDKSYRNEINLTLLNNDYPCALNELLEKGLLYVFVDRHQNNVYLIRHWFKHNQYRKGLTTNYTTLLRQVQLVEWEWQKKPLKEIKINENKVNEIKENKEEISQEEWDRLFIDHDKDKGEDDYD